MWLVVIVQPESSFSNDNVTVVEMLSAVRFAPPNCPDNAIEKHPACAAAISSSGLVPGAFSNRVVKEYCVLFNTPPGAEMLPLPSFRPPFQTALAFLCMRSPRQFRYKVATAILNGTAFPRLAHGELLIADLDGCATGRNRTEQVPRVNPQTTSDRRSTTF